MPTEVTAAVEGTLDKAVLARIADWVNVPLGIVHVKGGKSLIDRRLASYNEAARLSPWIVLRDLDQDADCAPALVSSRLPLPAAHMRFRLAVRSIESWLMADGTAMADFLCVNAHVMPSAPDSLASPKKELLRLARSSRNRDIRLDLLPPPATSATVGPAYNARLEEFAASDWRPRAAARRSPSLAGCIAALRELRGLPQGHRSR